MRFSSTRNVCRNAIMRSFPSPSSATGSVTPQYAEIGYPCQIGYTAATAFSQTVKAKSIGGASADANSFQSLLLRFAVGNPKCFSKSSAIGFMRPAGWFCQKIHFLIVAQMGKLMLPGVAQRPPRQTPFLNLAHMTRQEIETLLRLLADMKREELTLLMRWRIKSELMGRVY